MFVIIAQQGVHAVCTVQTIFTTMTSSHKQPITPLRSAEFCLFILFPNYDIMKKTVTDVTAWWWGAHILDLSRVVFMIVSMTTTDKQPHSDFSDKQVFSSDTDSLICI